MSSRISSTGTLKQHTFQRRLLFYVSSLGSNAGIGRRLNHTADGYDDFDDQGGSGGGDAYYDETGEEDADRCRLLSLW